MPLYEVLAVRDSSCKPSIHTNVFKRPASTKVAWGVIAHKNMVLLLCGNGASFTHCGGADLSMTEPRKLENVDSYKTWITSAGKSDFRVASPLITVRCRKSRSGKILFISDILTVLFDNSGFHVASPIITGYCVAVVVVVCLLLGFFFVKSSRSTGDINSSETD